LYGAVGRLCIPLRAAAQQLGVDQAYLSRVEAEKVAASDMLIHRLAVVLGCDKDELLLAGRLPEPIRDMVARQPSRVTSALRTMAEMCVSEPGTPYGEPLFAERGERAIEDGFPFEAVSEVAEVESWRKEVYQPVYHVHKWWAQRLGSVFRAAILGAAAPKGSAVMELFYEPVRLPGVVVFDPFMGSGTTVGEAHKLGCTVIGRDINPVANRAVRVALGPVDRCEVHALLPETGGRCRPGNPRDLPVDGQPRSALRGSYFFWVKCLPCSACGESVDLFSNYVFAMHAYKKDNPEAKFTCPECSDVLSGRYDSTDIACGCGARFDPQEGSAKRTTAVCRRCGHEFPIAKTAKRAGRPPAHRLYPKLVLRSDGVKEYLRITAEDLTAFEAARQRLAALDPPLPRVPIGDGHNTRQILNYGYRYWHELFNDRQLLALAMLASAIRGLPEGSAREALAVLFSGVLEFNNLFASYKGEGTGAAHVLAPHPEARADAHRSQSLGHAQELGRVLHAVPVAAAAGARLPSSAVRDRRRVRGVQKVGQKGRGREPADGCSHRRELPEERPETWSRLPVLRRFRGYRPPRQERRSGGHGPPFLRQRPLLRAGGPWTPNCHERAAPSSTFGATETCAPLLVASRRSQSLLNSNFWHRPLQAEREPEPSPWLGSERPGAGSETDRPGRRPSSLPGCRSGADNTRTLARVLRA
jgi:DNA methylase